MAYLVDTFRLEKPVFVDFRNRKGDFQSVIMERADFDLLSTPSLEKIVKSGRGYLYVSFPHVLFDTPIRFGPIKSRGDVILLDSKPNKYDLYTFGDQPVQFVLILVHMNSFYQTYNSYETYPILSKWRKWVYMPIAIPIGV